MPLVHYCRWHRSWQTWGSSPCTSASQTGQCQCCSGRPRTHIDENWVYYFTKQHLFTLNLSRIWRQPTYSITNFCLNMIMAVIVSIFCSCFTCVWTYDWNSPQFWPPETCISWHGKTSLSMQGFLSSCHPVQICRLIFLLDILNQRATCNATMWLWYLTNANRPQLWCPDNDYLRTETRFNYFTFIKSQWDCGCIGISQLILFFVIKTSLDHGWRSELQIIPS